MDPFWNDHINRHRLPARVAQPFPALVGPDVRSNFDGSRARIDPPAASAQQISSVAGDALYPWKMEMAPYRGTGADPHRADGGDNTRKMMVWFTCPGDVEGDMPSNMFYEFVCFGTPATLDQTIESATWTTFYLRTPVSETDLGRGDLRTATPQIMTFSGTNLSDEIGDARHFGDDGALPTYDFKVIARVAYYGGALHLNPQLQHCLDLGLTVSGRTSEGYDMRQFVRTLVNSGII